MTGVAQRILETFEALPESDKHAVAVEILRRTLDVSYSAPEDEELLLAADQVFLELDRREEPD